MNETTKWTAVCKQLVIQQIKMGRKELHVDANIANEVWIDLLQQTSAKKICAYLRGKITVPADKRRSKNR